MRASSDGIARPGDGGRDDEVDVGGGEVGGLEGVDERLRAELDGVLDEEVVGVPEVAQPGVLLQRQHGVAPLDAGVAVEPAQQGAVEAALRDDLAERLGDLLLRVGVLRQRTTCGQDPHDSLRRLDGWTGGGARAGHRATTRSVASTRAMPIAATNGSRPRPATTRIASARRQTPAATASATGRRRADHHHGGRGDEHDGRHGGDPALPEPVREAADPGGGVVVEVGQHVEEVGADPEQRAADGPPPRGRRGPGEGDEDGQPAERHGVRHPRPDRRLEPEVVGPARRDAHEVHGPGGDAAGERQHQAGGQGDGARRPDQRHGDGAADQRLVGAPAAAVALEVDEVVAPADRQLAGEHGGGDERAPGRGPGPAATASSTTRTVTARVGPACAAATSAATREVGARAGRDVSGHGLPCPPGPLRSPGPAPGHSSDGTHPARVTPGGAARRPPGRGR